MKEKFQAEMNGTVLRSEYKDLLNKYNMLVRFLREKGILDEETFKEVSNKETQHVLDIIEEKSK